MKAPAAGIAVFLALAWISPSPAAAAQPPASPEPFQVPPPVTDMKGIGVAVPYLLLLLILAGGGIYLLKNGLPFRGARGPAGRKLQISEMRSLGNRQFLVVVEYDDTKMLLGVTPGKIDYLCPLETHAGSAADFAALVPGEAKPPADP